MQATLQSALVASDMSTPKCLRMGPVPEHLGGKVNVTRGVDEIDEELAAIKGQPAGLLQRHGSALLALVKLHCNKNGQDS